ncbi:MAG: 50S ribosomal protein L25 [Patescibacteria group bacterium]|nr:50S ribosomal protein L25 [Patescibacteria group bacterium]
MESLKVEKREIVGKKVSQIRENGKIPAVIYGQGIKPTNLTAKYIPFEKIYEKAGNSTLINLKINDQEIPVLIHQIFRNVVSGKIDHIDFYKIKYGQKLTASVELNFIGEPKAVKELGGTLVAKIKEVEIKCLPKDLISEIKVDLTALKSFDDVIHIKDLKISETIEILGNPDIAIASVSKPRIEKKEKGEKEEADSEKTKDEDKKDEKAEEKPTEQTDEKK